MLRDAILKLLKAWFQGLGYHAVCLKSDFQHQRKFQGHDVCSENFISLHTMHTGTNLSSQIYNLWDLNNIWKAVPQIDAELLSKSLKRLNAHSKSWNIYLSWWFLHVLCAVTGMKESSILHWSMKLKALMQVGKYVLLCFMLLLTASMLDQQLQSFWICFREESCKHN